MITCTLAIPTFQREVELINTVEQALRLEPPPNEIIVVDQSSSHTHDTERRLKELKDNKQIRYIRLSIPNLPAARNTALYAATSEIIIFIDDDVEIGRASCRERVSSARRRHSFPTRRSSDLIFVNIIISSNICEYLRIFVNICEYL